jgi:hypothetical protein
VVAIVVLVGVVSTPLRSAFIYHLLDVRRAALVSSRSCTLRPDLKDEFAARPAFLDRSVIEYRQIQPAEALGVGYDVELDDLPVHDREAEHQRQPSTRGHDDPHGPVQERYSREG